MKKNTEEKMVQKRRVVITGLGAVTPIGNTVPEFWTNVRKGTVGIGEITGFDTKDFKVKLAAQVKDFHGEEKMDAKAARRMELFSQYAVAAAKEALEDEMCIRDRRIVFCTGPYLFLYSVRSE